MMPGSPLAAEDFMAKTTLLFALIIAALSSHSTAQAGKAQAPAVSTAPVNVVLADATPVKLRLGATAGTNAVRVGENLDLEVAEDVRLGDVIVIAKGSPASASVTNLRSGVSAGRGGWIDVNLESVNLADGQHVPIRASRIKPVRNDQSMIVSSSGQDASIAPGTDLTTYINGDQPLDLTRIRAAGGPAAEVKVTSTPANAEVTVDGRVGGSTPCALHLGAGDHVIVVRMSGFQPWQNKVHVAGEPVAVNAELLKQDGTEAMPSSKPSEPSLGDLARAARARKPALSTTTVVMEQDGQTPTRNQTGHRDPMEPPASPKK
jgi:hypothetical protein